MAFVDRVLKPAEAVQGVIGIGSISTGAIQPDSDIDIVVFFDPLDWYIIPAEFIWRPSDNSFHSIFTSDADVRKEGVHIDALRLDLRRWSDSRFVWPEGRRAELSNGWIAFDRNKQIRRLIAHRTAYSETLRQTRLDEAIVWLDQHLAEGVPERKWDSLGPTAAHDRLQAAFEQLVRALFAYNWAWLPWRDRQMDALLRLEWLPSDYRQRFLIAANAPGLHYESYLKRAEMLRGLFADVQAKLIEDGLYSGQPVDQAYIRSHDGPGYAWNMDEWNAENLRRAISELAQEDL